MKYKPNAAAANHSGEMVETVVLLTADPALLVVAGAADCVAVVVALVAIMFGAATNLAQDPGAPLSGILSAICAATQASCQVTPALITSGYCR